MFCSIQIYYLVCRASFPFSNPYRPKNSPPLFLPFLLLSFQKEKMGPLPNKFKGIGGWQEKRWVWDVLNHSLSVSFLQGQLHLYKRVTIMFHGLDKRLPLFSLTPLFSLDRANQKLALFSFGPFLHPRVKSKGLSLQQEF